MNRRDTDPLTIDDFMEDRFVVPPRSLASQTGGYRPAASGRLVGLLLAALSGAFVAGALMFFVGRALWSAAQLRRNR